MSTVLSSPDIGHVTARTIVENMDPGANEALKLEVHKKKTERADAEQLFKQGGQGLPMDNGVKVTSYAMPAVTSDAQPDLNRADQYIGSEKFDKAVSAQEKTFTMNMFSKGFDLFVLMREVNKLMRAETNEAQSAVTEMRNKMNKALKENIATKGREAMVMSITGSVLSMGVSAAGTGSLLNNSKIARTDLKNTHKSIPAQEAGLRTKESALAKLDPKNQKDRAAITTLKDEIRDGKTAIDEMKFKSDLAQNRSDSAVTGGMAVQGSAQALAGIIEGLNQNQQAFNEVAVVTAQTGGEMLQEMSQKMSDMVNEQRDALQQSIAAMRDLTAQESSLYSTVSGNVK